MSAAAGWENTARDRLGRFEPLVPVVMAGYGLTVLAARGGQPLSKWLIAGGIGLFGAIEPYRWARHGLLAARALLLVVLAVLICSRTGSTSSDFLPWFVIIAATYPIICRPAVGLSIAAVSAGAPVALLLVGARGPGVVTMIERSSAVFVAGGLAVLLGRSISETTRAVRESDTRQRRFTMMAANSNDVIVLADPDERLTFVSASMERMLGYAPVTFIGRRIRDLIHPEDAARYEALLLAIRDEPAEMRLEELRVQHQNGKWLWAEMRATNRLNDPEVKSIVIGFHEVTERHIAIDGLKASEALFRSLAAASPAGIFRADPAGRVHYVNERWQEITGLTGQDASGHGWHRAVHPVDLPVLHDAWNSAVQNDVEFSVRVRVSHPARGERWVEIRSAPFRNEHGDAIGRVGTIVDITEQVVSQRDAERMKAVIEATPDFVGVADAQGRLLYLNRAGRELIGLPLDQPLTEDDDVSVLAAYPPRSREVYLNEAVRTALNDGVWTGELEVRRHDDTFLPVSQVVLAPRTDSGSVAFFAGISRDISERKNLEGRLAFQATHDSLTGLPNRALLLDRLGVAMARARRRNSMVAVLFCDLDNFKVVNDSLGHDVGDALLMAVATRILAIVRPSDTVARFGGDEFVILCDELTDENDAIDIAERLAQTLTDPLEVANQEVYATTSIGIAFQRRKHERPEALIRDADAAMYRAKERGRARFEVFDEHMHELAMARLDTERALRRALDRHELRVYYQPKVWLDSMTPSGFEALVRWEHPERGLLKPSEFIGFAEESRLIVDIGTWVLTNACRQHVRWQTDYPDLWPLDLSVNLSARQLADPNLPARLAETLHETGMDPASLTLEITETVLMDNAQQAVELLDRLKLLGVKIAVDDFGTGYSSLAYLRRFPVDILKIDRAFVDGLGRDPEDTEIVRLITTLARTLRLRVVAEGVETPEQLAELRELGCDRVQGFFVARPMPAPGVEAWLDSMRPRMHAALA